MSHRLWLAASAVLFASAGALGTSQHPDLTAAIEEVSVEYGASVLPGDLAEGCARAQTGVDLVRFGVRTTNVGPVPLMLGDPACPDCLDEPGAICGNPQFHCSPAGGHDHPHYTDYARYELIDDADGVVATGGKLGFCLLDDRCPAGVPEIFTCDFQGLSPQCSDYYNPELGCQYIDVTGVPDGRYRIRVTLDPLALITEEDEENNVALASVSIARGPQPDEELPGKFVVFNPTRGFEFSARGRSFTLPDALHDPTVAGADLRVIPLDLLGGVIIPLPAEGWVALGDPPGAKGYRFRGRGLAGSSAESCTVSIRPTAVRVRCEDPRFVNVPLPLSGRLRVAIVAGGGKRYCATFGGETLENDTSWLKRRNARPGPCDG